MLPDSTPDADAPVADGLGSGLIGVGFAVIFVGTIAGFVLVVLAAAERHPAGHPAESSHLASSFEAFCVTLVALLLITLTGGAWRATRTARRARTVPADHNPDTAGRGAA